MSTGQPPANAPGDDDSVRPAWEPLSGILDAERAPDEEVPPAADADEAPTAGSSGGGRATGGEVVGAATNANTAADAPTSRQPADAPASGGASEAAPEGGPATGGGTTDAAGGSRQPAGAGGPSGGRATGSEDFGTATNANAVEAPTSRQPAGAGSAGAKKAPSTRARATAKSATTSGQPVDAGSATAGDAGSDDEAPTSRQSAAPASGDASGAAPAGGPATGAGTTVNAAGGMANPSAADEAHRSPQRADAGSGGGRATGDEAASAATNAKAADEAPTFRQPVDAPTSSGASGAAPVGGLATGAGTTVNAAGSAGAKKAPSTRTRATAKSATTSGQPADAGTAAASDAGSDDEAPTSRQSAEEPGGRIGPKEPPARTRAAKATTAAASDADSGDETTGSRKPAAAEKAATSTTAPGQSVEDAEPGVTTAPQPRRWRDESNPDELEPPAAYVPKRGRDPEGPPPPKRTRPVEAPDAGRPVEVTAVKTDEPPADDPWARPTAQAAAAAAKLRPGAPPEQPAAPKDPGKAKDRDKAKDRWDAFVATEEPPPTPSDKALAAVGRFFRHEWTVASIIALVVAVVMTWPTLRYPLYKIPQDLGDPILVTWMLAWPGHILLADPSQLWQGNAFYPELWSYAFTDSLLGYAPFGMIGEGPTAAVLRYNIVFVLAHALAAVGAYALVRQLGANRTGAAVAGAAFAYAPWLLSQAGHLHVISNGGIPLALAMLARGHGYSFRYGYRPKRRHAGWALAGWLVAAWQLSLGFAIGLAFAYALALLVLVVAVTCLIRRVWWGRKLFFTDLAGGAVFATVGALLAIPYFRVAELYPNARRSFAEVDFYSPPWRGFFTAPQESRVWGESHAAVRATFDWQPEMTLLPGFILIALAVAGLLLSVFKLRHRLLLLLLVVGSGVLAMGTKAFGGEFYMPLYDLLPGWDGLRTPGRLVMWTTLFLAVLAAGAVSAFTDRVEEISASRVPPWPSPWLRIATLIPLALVLAEGLNVTPHPIVPLQPAAMREVDGPLLVLPSTGGTDQNVMMWSTTKFQDIVNGTSGFTPPRLDEIRQVTASFPDPVSIDYLRRLGVRNVIILRDRVGGTPWQTTIDLPVDALGIRREDLGESVVYRL